MPAFAGMTLEGRRAPLTTSDRTALRPFRPEVIFVGLDHLAANDVAGLRVAFPVEEYAAVDLRRIPLRAPDGAVFVDLVDDADAGDAAQPQGAHGLPEAKREVEVVRHGEHGGGGLPVEPEVARVLARAREALAAAGAVIADAEPDLAGADETFGVLRAVMMAGRYGSLLETARDQLKDTLVWNIEQGLALTSEQIAAARLGRAEIFGRVNPSSPTAATTCSRGPRSRSSRSRSSRSG